MTLDIRAILIEKLDGAFDDRTATYLDAKVLLGSETVLLEASPDYGPTRSYRIQIEEVTIDGQ